MGADENAKGTNAKDANDLSADHLRTEKLERGKELERGRVRSPAEWITLSVSTLVLSLLIGLVIYDWQISKDLPPTFRIEVTEAVRFSEGRYYQPFTLRNTGGSIARTVQVTAELSLSNGEQETGEQQFDFLSGKERKKGSFIFDHDPREGALIIRVASFGLP